ncbi:YceI family protein [Pseudomonas sp. P9_31]|uniref:YceI family protein n=1 Tax=Pseudomonas sp. P9_31 TaxID=3043448 RepID=UPI002A369882|nr:YceI family protein [Pseudomonas sp. P9_31]WPN56057.1 YceI family protein [Pseudomonas sp. P9_31]
MTPRFPRFAALLAILLVGTLPSAHAVEYTQVNTTASKISFTYSQFGSRAYGTFGKFDATVDFDTANPTAAHARLTIDLASIDAGSSDANTELQKPAWFNTTDYPVATFESTGVKALGNHRYLITGKLNLRGLTRELQVKVLLKPEHAIGVFDGDIIVKRSDFKIGEGEWGDSVVSNDINIRFRIVAPER